MGKFTVTVGNVGVVYDGDSRNDAKAAYGEYKRQSVGNYGRAAGESVVMMAGGDILWEHTGTADAENPED